MTGSFPTLQTLRLRGVLVLFLEPSSPVLQLFRSKKLILTIWVIVFIMFVGGFLLADSSGLLGIGPAITPSSVVAKVNGVDIPWLAWQNTANQLAQQQEQSSGRGLTLDERARLEDQAFEQLVSNVLLDQEYKRRGIFVTDAEIREAAQQSPPPEMQQNPELQTDGRFDVAKYRRLLSSAAARQQGLLLQLEAYYRSEIPRAKLYDQLAGDVFVSDAKLWASYADQNDSTQVSYVTFDGTAIPDSAVTVPDVEMRAYYDRNRDAFERPGRAVVSVVALPRAVSSEDSSAALARANALRNEILGGAKFEDVARRESADSVSGAAGGDLGRAPAANYVAQFSNAARSLRVGEISAPALSPFGYHIIRKDAQPSGDTLVLHHILVRIQQTDSNAVRTDRRADSLSRIAANADQPSRLDSAAKVLGLGVERLTVFEGEQAVGPNGRALPSVSAWAFGGAKTNDISDLYDSDDVYVVARLDSLVDKGIPTFEQAKDDIRRLLIGRKKAQSLQDRAKTFVASVAAAGSLENAAKAANLAVQKTEVFTRPQFVPGLGRLSEAVGAAFTLPTGTVSQPIVTDQGVFVMRVDRRVPADSATWLTQKDSQRTQAVSAIQQLRVRTFLSEIRKSARVDDRRKELNAASRAQAEI